MKRESLRSNTLHKEQARNIIVTTIIMLAIAICLMYPLLSTILLSSLILSYLLFYSLILSSLLFSSLQLPLAYWYLINKYIQVRITVDHILRSSVHIFFQVYTGMTPLFLDLHLADLLISSRLLSSPKFLCFSSQVRRQNRIALALAFATTLMYYGLSILIYYIAFLIVGYDIWDSTVIHYPKVPSVVFFFRLFSFFYIC